jgi:glutathione peroxidase
MVHDKLPCKEMDAIVMLAPIGRWPVDDWHFFAFKQDSFWTTLRDNLSGERPPRWLVHTLAHSVIDKKPCAAPATDDSRAHAQGAPTMSFYAFSAAPLGKSEPVSLEKYRGKVLLVVNTAAHCGYTPQYAPLGELCRKYESQGFAVLGFVSDDFGRQAGTTEELEACSLKHRATFDQFAQLHAKSGPDQHPLFAWLTSQPGFPGEVKWNFNKWLIGRNGELLARFGSGAEPEGAEVRSAIEAALGASL